ncbi:CheR family methyltransferase [Lentzea rhizosphaerae]|uniref:CheR family methyltransferase n=1 Tax=Lentzea rhizosphaerae TaxID=2041025 RepID=A0ABV8C423_9PSEU
MSQIDVEDYGDYIDQLQVNADEFSVLFNTILINVTAFFRDPEAWEYLRQNVIPALLAEATGPERFRQQVKIYATDVDDEALSHARHASYAERDLQSLPSELATKYFEHQNGRYSFREGLRRSVIFGRNDLVQDAPISPAGSTSHWCPRACCSSARPRCCSATAASSTPSTSSAASSARPPQVRTNRRTSFRTRWCTIAGWTCAVWTNCGNTPSPRARWPRSW